MKGLGGAVNPEPGISEPATTVIPMIITTPDGSSFDTDRDLTAPERHILQKLFLWESMAVSLEQFREKKGEALAMGWNGSGPIKESPAMRRIIGHLETRLALRLHGS